jgi:hypothetical protein
VREILLPHTEAGVLVQVLIVVALALVVAIAVRRERSLVSLTIGVATILLSLMGVRALH